MKEKQRKYDHDPNLVPFVVEETGGLSREADSFLSQLVSARIDTRFQGRAAGRVAAYTLMDWRARIAVSIANSMACAENAFAVRCIHGEHPAAAGNALPGGSAQRPEPLAAMGLAGPLGE